MRAAARKSGPPDYDQRVAHLDKLERALLEKKHDLAKAVSSDFGNRSSHETLWRDDRVYDVVIDIGWNRGPIRRGRGSAIFLHLARHGFEPTAGCVAVDRTIIARLLAAMGRHTRIVIRN